MAAAAVCPVIGSTTSVLPPGHPALSSDPEAKVAHHDRHTIHEHPASPTIPSDKSKMMDAEQCPVVKSQARKESVDNAICPVVGAVSAYLPPTHPKLTEKEGGTICPVTNAKLEHHKDNVKVHPSVPDGAPASKCPVAGAA